ncbi:MAG TPA: thioesterase, partial [Acidimicrobiaceae bacterium]|nr:thioesterase [Acidimicrobiaceae bacterium]
AVQPHLDDGLTTVGIHICVSHQAAVASGEQVEITGTVIEVDRKRIVFEVVVAHGDEVVSKGTHDRFVVG